MKQEIDIEALLQWVYQKQKADMISSRGVGMFDAEAMADGIKLRKISADGCFRIEQTHLLGAAVDGGGLMSFAGQLHPDAETIHETVMKLNKIESWLLISSAKAGDPPDWMPEAKASMEPVMKKGRIVMIYDDNRHIIGCRVTVGTTQVYIDAKRELYSMWWKALKKLADNLEDKLASYELSGSVVSSTPWVNEKKRTQHIDFAKTA